MPKKRRNEDLSAPLSNVTEALDDQDSANEEDFDAEVKPVELYYQQESTRTQDWTAI